MARYFYNFLVVKRAINTAAETAIQLIKTVIDLVKNCGPFSETEAKHIVKYI